MSTITRVSLVDEQGPALEARLKRYNEGFERVASTLGNTEQYALFAYLIKKETSFDKPYLVVVSRGLYPIELPQNYNLILTLSLDNFADSERILTVFERDTGIKLREAPRGMAERNQKFDIAFEGFKRNPVAMIAEWKKSRTRKIIIP